MLVMGDYIVRRKQPDLRALLGEADAQETEFVKEPALPKRAGKMTLETIAVAEARELTEDEQSSQTRVKMTSRPMHHPKHEWVPVLDELEGELLCACDGTNTINDIMVEYTAVPKDAGNDDERMEQAQNLLQNIVHRLVRLYEQTLISW